MSSAAIENYESYDAMGLAELVRSGDVKPEALPAIRTLIQVIDATRCGSGSDAHRGEESG